MTTHQGQPVDVRDNIPRTTAITYPNREHENADKAAKRRALIALDRIEDQVRMLRRRIERDVADGDDTQILSDLVRKVTAEATALAVLSNVREWHAADLAELNAPDPSSLLARTQTPGEGS